MDKSERILVVDDEIGMCRLLKETLTEEGYAVEAIQQGAQALKRVQESSFDLVISDIRMPKINGMDLMKAIKDKRQDMPVILMTAYGSVESAVEAMKHGAVDYITKPFKTEEIKMVVSQVLEKIRLQKENRELRAALADRYAFKNVIGKTPQMRKVFEFMERIKDTPSTILITGESGTGKELVARTIHHNSVRKDRPFVAVDCSALPESLLESELFGVEPVPGQDPKIGLLESAHGGTVLLDEIGDMAVNLQTKLLRFLQEGEIRRVGGTDVKKVDVRVIAATQQDLQAAIKEERFREDLYYRLAVVPIHLPPLRERKEDIPALVDFFLKELSKKLGKIVSGCEPRAIEWMTSQPWPGNVRELKNALEYAASVSLSPILNQSNFIQARPGQEPVNLQDLSFRDAKQQTVDKFERDYLETLLKRAGGNISQASRLADMDRKNLYDLLKKHGLKADETEAKPPQP